MPGHHLTLDVAGRAAAASDSTSYWDVPEPASTGEAWTTQPMDRRDAGARLEETVACA